MGDGKRLRQILDEQGKSVRWLAKETSINSSTLFSIIRKDTSIRYDFALRIANTLNVEISDICSDKNMIEESWENENDITLPEFGGKINDVLFGNRIKRYLKYTLYPLMSLFGIEMMPRVDEHLTNYYTLSDKGRKAVDQFIEYQLTIEKDEDRAQDVKSITHW